MSTLIALIRNVGIFFLSVMAVAVIGTALTGVIITIFFPMASGLLVSN